MDPRVSVIIPTFNRRESLIRAVRSCLEQTHPVLEILVCDDGSTDGSQEGIAELGSARVHWIGGTHAGRPAPARNRGLANAQGDWVAFLDDDDAWFPNKLEIQFRSLGGTGASASCTNAECIAPDQVSKGNYFRSASGPLTFVDLLAMNKVISSSLLAKKELFRIAGGFPESPELIAIEDYALWLRLATMTDILYCEEALVYYADTAATSLRAQRTDEAQMRHAVLSDLRSWTRTKELTPQQRSALARNFRASKRRIGRPLLEWLFIR